MRRWEIALRDFPVCTSEDADHVTIVCLHTRDSHPGVIVKTIDYFSMTKELNSQENNMLL